MINLYDTKMGRQSAHYAKEVIEWAQEQLILKNDLVQRVYGNTAFKINPTVSTDTVVLLDHPVFFEHGGEQVVLVDTRRYEKPDGTTRNSREITPLYHRALLGLALIDDPSVYRPAISGLTAVFTEWVLSAVRLASAANTLQLEQLRVFLIASYYFSIQDSAYLKRLSVDDYQANVLKVATRELRMASNLVNEVITSEPFIYAVEECREYGICTLDEWLKAATKYLDSPAIRLDAGGIAVLVANNSWIGDQRIALAGTALEYPPYLAWMVGKCLDEGIYRRTKIGIAVESAKRGRANVNGINRWVQEVIQPYINQD